MDKFINQKSLKHVHIYLSLAVPEAPEIQPEPVTHITAVSVNLTWISGFNGGSKQNFTVKYRKVGDVDYVSDGDIVQDPGYQNRAHKFISNLTEKTQYKFRITAQNKLGHSDPHDTLFRTKGKY